MKWYINRCVILFCDEYINKHNTAFKCTLEDFVVRDNLTYSWATLEHSLMQPNTRQCSSVLRAFWMLYEHITAHITCFQQSGLQVLSAKHIIHQTPDTEIKKSNCRCLAIVRKILNKLITPVPGEVTRTCFELRDRAFVGQEKISGSICWSGNRGRKVRRWLNILSVLSYLLKSDSGRDRRLLLGGTRKPGDVDLWGPLAWVTEQRGTKETERSEDAADIQTKTNSFISASPEAGLRDVSAASATTSKRFTETQHMY